MTKTFKDKYTLEERKNEADRLYKKYPDRVPVIIEISNNNKNDLQLNKKKFLVPENLTIGQFMGIIRKRVLVNETQALFLFFNNNLAPMSRLIKEAQRDYRDEDGFLYGSLSLENTFG